MILKLKTDAGWVYIDGVEDFRTFGYFRTGDASSEQPDGLAMFDGVLALRPAVDRMWGDHREFDREVWPTFGDEHLAVPDGRYVQSGVARTDDDRNILVLWADEAFLLSDDGKTVDRLR